MRRKACMIRVDFHPCIANTISRYCMRCSEGKLEIIQFLQKLVENGYRHFILLVEQPSDVWIAELICYFQKSCALDLIYSIGIWQYEEDSCEWIEDLPFDWKTIAKNAYHVFPRRKDWYDPHYHMERLYVSVGEKWYDACDRFAAASG